MDIEKEFKTLSVLSTTLLILGVALIIGGTGTALLIHSPEPPRARIAQPENIEERDNTEAEASSRTIPVRSRDADVSTVMRFTSQLGVRIALLGIVFVISGLILRRLIRDQLDDGFTETDQELFKVYAQQLAAAEKKKKRLK